MNQYKANDTIFEALFRQAIIDEFDEEINSILQNEQTSEIYSSSPEFKRQMQKLFIKERRDTMMKNVMLYGGKIASIFIIVVGMLFMILLFNTEVQATVGKVLTEWYEQFTSFKFGGDEVTGENKDWVLNYLPRGYSYKSQEVLGNITIIELENNQAEKIRFSYRSEGSITNISVDNENHEISKYRILDSEVIFISAKNNSFDNGVIWNKDNYTLDLWGKIPLDELKKMVESIVEK